MKTMRRALLRIARRVERYAGRLPLGAGPALKKSLILRSVKQRILRLSNPPGPVDAPDSSPLCALPWVHAQIETTGDVQLCCVARHTQGSIGNIHQQSLDQIFQSGRMHGIREQMLRGEWPDDCAPCREREVMRLSSFRHASNKTHAAVFEKLQNGAPPSPALRSLDLRLNNVCNFRCRFCYGFASTRWYSEHNLVFPDKPISEKYQGFDRLASFWEDFDRLAPGLETIHLAGGEPLIIDAHYRLLEKLIAIGRTDVRLQYDTNLSRLQFKHWDVIDLWKHFPHLEISMSLDGAGQRGEYIRDGLCYQQWLQNARRVQRELPHAERSLHFVVCIFNVLDLADHFKAILEGNFVEPGRVMLTFLQWPEHLSVQVLKPELKANAEKNLLEFLKSDYPFVPEARAQIEALIDFMKAEDLYSIYGRDFADRTLLLDAARGQDALKMFPELAAMFASKQNSSRPIAH